MASNHRYILRRDWLGSGGILNWIMLNPSTADDVFEDPTIRKCIGFAKRWGYRGIVVTNLFAYRATFPSDLMRLAGESMRLAIGEDNDMFLREIAKACDAVVCAWGNHGSFRGRDLEVASFLGIDRDLYCIGLTGTGSPLHPCRAQYTERPLIYRQQSRAFTQAF